MKGSTVSRRVSEFVGVALFAAALIWIVALASYNPADPAWFFSAGIDRAPENFAGRVGAFLAEASFQVAGYAAYLIPAFMVMVGWNYFWCRDVDAAGSKAMGAGLLFSCISAFMGLVVGTVGAAGKSFRAGGYIGEWLSAEMSEYLNRTGSVIVLLTLGCLAVIISTQFSIGRITASLFGAVRDGLLRALDRIHAWREDRRRDQQRREVIAKYTKDGAPPPEIKRPAAGPAPAEPPAKAPRRRAA